MMFDNLALLLVNDRRGSSLERLTSSLSRVAVAARFAAKGLEAASAATSSDLRTAANGANTSALDVLAVNAESALATQTAEQAAAARRRAVLSGLADLGYEVRQSMTTALVEIGRVIVRKPSEADYGMELSASAGAARIQIRLVGAATPAAPRAIATRRHPGAATSAGCVRSWRQPVRSW